METATVIAFPERRYQPNPDHLREYLSDEQQSPELLFWLVVIGVQQLHKLRAERSGTPEACQAAVDAFALIHAASGRVLGLEVLR
jgi:hypothetical protein